MRCLRCGKDLPLLKRLSGGEFCSDAHRREYHQEYSELALSRLLQALPQNPPPGQALRGQTPLGQAPPGEMISPLRIAEPEIVVPEDAPAAHPVAEKPVTAVAAPPVPQPPVRSRAAEKAPPAMAGKLIQQPAASAPPAGVLTGSECETLVTTVKPIWPSRTADLTAAELFRAVPMACWNHWEIQKSAAHPVDARVELRSVVRSAPSMNFDLRIGGPRDWTLASQTVEVPAVDQASPGEAALWQAPLLDFAPRAVALDDLISSPLAPLAPDIPSPAVASSEPSIPGEPRQAVAAIVAPAVSLPLILKEAAPERAAPVQVFADWLSHGSTIQIARSEALPLRPVMVLAPADRKTAPTTSPAPVSSPPVTQPSPPLALSPRVVAPSMAAARTEPSRVVSPSVVSPSIAAPRTEPSRVESPRLELPPTATPEPADLPAPIPALAAPPPPRADLGLPEFRTQPPGLALARRIWMMIAVAAGILILVVGIFFFASTKADSTPWPLAAGVQWNADFAPDAVRQRQVSLLRSSANAADYRVEFESSIRVKALGWVYRAQNPRNFYVSKVELRAPGADPVFVVAHYAVIGGIDQARTETPLRVRAPMGRNYRIRFEAVGNRFTTWIQEQKADEWTDGRLATGGTGLYREGIEQASLNSVFEVTPLDGIK